MTCPDYFQEIFHCTQEIFLLKWQASFNKIYQHIVGKWICKAVYRPSAVQCPSDEGRSGGICKKTMMV